MLALFILRRREAGAPRPFRTFGYPWAPGLFAVVSLLIVANALWTDLLGPVLGGAPLGPSAAGLLVVALGLPLYRGSRGQSCPSRKAPEVVAGVAEHG